MNIRGQTKKKIERKNKRVSKLIKKKFCKERAICVMSETSGDLFAK